MLAIVAMLMMTPVAGQFGPFSAIENEIFSRKRCKELISFTENAVTYTRPNSKKISATFSRTVWFDSLGRPIKEVSSDSSRWKIGTSSMEWFYLPDGCIQIVGKSPEEQYRCTDGLPDTLVRLFPMMRDTARTVIVYRWKNRRLESITGIGEVRDYIQGSSRVNYAHYFYDEDGHFQSMETGRHRLVFIPGMYAYIVRHFENNQWTMNLDYFYGDNRLPKEAIYYERGKWSKKKEAFKQKVYSKTTYTYEWR